MFDVLSMVYNKGLTEVRVHCAQYEHKQEEKEEYFIFELGPQQNNIKENIC